MHSVDSPPDLPRSLGDRLSGYRWSRNTIGESAAGVYRLAADGRPALFLKVEDAGSLLAELPDEVRRLEWLSGQGIACPDVVGYETHAGRNWLLMTALAGGDLVSRPLPPPTAVVMVAEALRTLHALDIRSCPFDHRLDNRIPRARAHMQAGLVDADDFDDERQGRTPESAFADLLALKPASEDFVVTHGDACMPNFIADGTGFSGFIDCARLGVADRHQDLGLASWSIVHNLGERWMAPFLDAYGLPADPEKLSYYRLLDEFF